VIADVLASRFAPAALRRRRLRRQSGLPVTGRVFGIGLSRTGTTSLTRALRILGYRSLHYPDDERTREEILAFLSTGDPLRLSILERFDAVTDTPICATFEALDPAYPGSTFILTTREKHAWLDSCRRYWADWIEPILREPGPEATYMSAIHERLYGTAGFDPDRFSTAYDDYQRRVGEHFRERPADLLTVDICGGDGWDPLCGFLNAPIPRTEFPWEANR
jgi:Sulfotransferase domain